jgi:hypothetical protein
MQSCRIFQGRPWLKRAVLLTYLHTKCHIPDPIMVHWALLPYLTGTHKFLTAVMFLLYILEETALIKIDSLSKIYLSYITSGPYILRLHTASGLLTPPCCRYWLHKIKAKRWSGPHLVKIGQLYRNLKDGMVMLQACFPSWRQESKPKRTQLC